MAPPIVRDYAGCDLYAVCVKCGHRTTVTPGQLAATAGWDVELESLRERLRCRQCGTQAGEFELDGDEVGAYSPLFRDAPRASAERGRALRRARLTARKTRDEVAAVIRGGAGAVAGVEAGYIGVDDAYVTRFLKACGLAAEWLDRESTEP